MSFIIFFIVLAVLVLVHELGHFLAAKKFGIRVDEFGLGFPPKAFGKKFGETEYTLNWIPFGGFVKIFGENPDEISENGPDSTRSMVNKPRWQQAIVLVAGIFFNFLFGWFLISIAFMSGVSASKEDYAAYEKYITDERITITQVNHSSPAFISGLKPGDNIVGIKTNKTTIEKENLVIPVIQDAIAQSKGEKIELLVKRGDQEKNILVNATTTILKDKFAIGISMEDVGTMKLPIHLSIYEGGKFTIYMIGGVFSGLTTLVIDALSGHPDLSSITGPVGIAGLVGDAANLGFVYLIMFTALISINLGVINLLPFPALDGGRLLIVIIESIRRKRVAPAITNKINTIGFIILLTLMLLVTFKDISSLL